MSKAELPPELQLILEQAETAKKDADLLFARSDFPSSVLAYNKCINFLSPLRGSPIGEFLAIRCLANQSNALIKLEMNDKSLEVASIALTIPSVLLDFHLMSKLLMRKARITLYLALHY